MSTWTTFVGDRRRQAHQRISAMNRHPSRRRSAKQPPPPVEFYLIAVIVAVFVMLGLVMVLSASSINELHQGRSPWGLFARQVMWALLGIVGLTVAFRTPLHLWRRMALPILGSAFALMCLPLIPGVGSRVNSATAWVTIGTFTFQPSEFLKLALVLYFADLFTKRRSEIEDLRRTFRPVIYVAAASAALCLLQGDFGSAIVLSAIAFAVMFIGGAPITPIVTAATVAVSGALVLALSSPRRADRFTAFMNVAAHKSNLSYQTWQAMIAVADGGWIGQGPARGSALLGGYLPLAQSDFIFAVIAQDLGLLGVIAVLGGFLILTYAGIQVALATDDPFAALIAGGIVSWFVIQTTINAGGVTGLMPITGLTLPFFSAGGSSLFITLTAAGLLLNVARHVK